MGTTFDNREKAFEAKFALDQEVRFKAEARRNMLLGLWAADKLDKHGDAAKEYARSIVAADLEGAGEEDVFRRIRQDFDAAGVDQSDHQIRRVMSDLMKTALEQVESGS